MSSISEQLFLDVILAIHVHVYQEAVMTVLKVTTTVPPRETVDVLHKNTIK